MALERIEESTKEGRGAEVGAIVCGEGMSVSTMRRCWTLAALPRPLGLDLPMLRQVQRQARWHVKADH